MANYTRERKNIFDTLDKAYEKYKISFAFLAPELKEFIGRNPVKLIKKMVECMPDDDECNTKANQLSTLVYLAVCADITKLIENFWEPVSNDLLGQILGSIDCEWKQNVVDYWIGKKSID